MGYGDSTVLLSEAGERVDEWGLFLLASPHTRLPVYSHTRLRQFHCLRMAHGSRLIAHSCFYTATIFPFAIA